jgi:hypothetical protein
MSGIVNKAKDALHKDHSTSTSHTHGTTTGHSTSTNAGPHDSNFANKADPRIESDLDASHNMGAAHGTGQIGTESTNTHSGPHVGSHTGTHTGMMGGISQSTNAGPHDVSSPAFLSSAHGLSLPIPDAFLSAELF